MIKNHLGEGFSIRKQEKVNQSEVSNFISLCEQGLRSLSKEKIQNLVRESGQIEIQQMFAITQNNRDFRQALLKALLNLPSEIWSSHRLEADHIWNDLLSEKEKAWLAAQNMGVQNPLSAFIFSAKRNEKTKIPA